MKLPITFRKEKVYIGDNSEERRLGECNTHMTH